MNGLVWFNPEQTSAEMPDKKIVIDRIEIDQQAVAEPWKRITFTQSQKQLRLEVNTPFFGNDYNVEFSYALAKRGTAPAPPDWLNVDAPITNKATINISSLGKGRYTLYIRKKTVSAQVITATRLSKSMFRRSGIRPGGFTCRSCWQSFWLRFFT